MPASPSFPSDGRGKWRKRKRDNSRRTTTTKNHHDDAEDDDEEDLDNDENLDHHDENSDHNASDPGPHEAELLSAAAIRCSDFPLVLRRAVDRPHASVLAIAALDHSSTGPKFRPVALENVSHGQLQALSAVPPDCAALDHNNGSSTYVVTPPPIMDGRGVIKWFGTRCLVVPMHSDWFSPATVHRLERQVVPHFFSGKFPEHTPEKYMEYRNYIVAKYMENPEKQLGASDFLGLIGGGDSEDLNRIVRFLDHWGIINYCALVPTREPWSRSSYLREESAGEISVPSAALKSIDSLIKFDKPKCKLKASEAYSTPPGRLNNDGDLDDRIRERFSENHCHCCSRPLPNVCYQSNKEVEIMLCSDCFHDGRFVIGHSSLDFAQTDLSKDHGDLDGESWTDQETLSLLEAVELHNENWNEIAELVGTKSKAQCILHFLRLPVEDGLLENIEVPGIIPVASSNQSSNGDIPRRRLSSSNGDSAGPVGDQEEAELETGFPFANSGNPVMALVAFLASSVGPRVAAACAHACLGVLAEGSDLSVSEAQLQNEGLGHNNRLNLENMNSRDIGLHGDIENSVHQKEENSDSRSLDEAGSVPLSEEKVKAAAKAGLAAAAMKAKLFADHEEREIQRLSANIINHQLKRLELKLKQFAEVETFLMKECEQLERTRQRLFSERSRFMATQMGGGVASVGPTGGGGPSSSARPQVMSAQPSMSGYSTTNQQSPHQQQQQQQQQAHMPFMPRQPMFGMGPRLPLSALQPTSSASSNSMFNNNSNNPPGNRPMLRPVHGTGSGLG